MIVLIIGSVVGVAAMGIEKVDSIRCMKRFSVLALIGYVAGAMVQIAEYSLLR